MAGYGNKEGPATLRDMDVLTCSICIELLTVPIFQCLNGHMQCRKCCDKNSQNCYTCSTPVRYRNRGVENVLEKLLFPCPNEEFGCAEYVSYDDPLDEQSPHLQQCKFTCGCLFIDCAFIGAYKDLYEHMVSEHDEVLKSFKMGKEISISIGTDARMVLKERRSEEEELLVVDRRSGQNGEYISVRCIAPQRKGNFSYRLTLHSSTGGEMCKSGDIKVVHMLDPDDIPEVDFLLTSPDFVITKITICIERKAPHTRGASTSSTRRAT